ncbi:MAG: hypothetical protein H8E78_03015, partial [Proteobacteria bacterium]|nr:hypothetical protein [Pseudomonadota bacterium]
MNRSTSNSLDPVQKVRRHAPIRSVSTRIILCVFVSTWLTAGLVSWVASGAIRDDVRTRMEERGYALIAEQTADLGRVLGPDWQQRSTPSCDVQVDEAAEADQPVDGAPCVSEVDVLLAFEPVHSALTGMRVLLTDGNGFILSAAGGRDHFRLGDRLPLSGLEMHRAR